MPARKIEARPTASSASGTAPGRPPKLASQASHPYAGWPYRYGASSISRWACPVASGSRAIA